MVKNIHKIIDIEVPGRYLLILEEECQMALNSPNLGVKPLTISITPAIGALLRHYRIEANLSQTELATLMGRSDHKHISDIEKGKIKKPRQKIIDDLSVHLGEAFKLAVKNLTDQSEMQSASE